MHNPAAQGNDFFLCDFCRRPYADDRPMIEGHRGSLICAPCLSLAYSAVVLSKEGDPLRRTPCTMCLEDRDQRQWASAGFPEVHICERCIRQGASTLAADPDLHWSKPVLPGSAAEPSEDDHIDPTIV